MTEPGGRAEFEVPDALVGERIDRVVSMLTELSRRVVHELIADGSVLLNGAVPAKPSIKVELGSTIELELPEVEGGPQADPAVEFNVVHEDEHVVVIDKSPDLVIHPGAGVTTGTLVNGLLARYPDVEGIGDDPTRPGIVHRLDKGTSGLLMVARTVTAYESLTGQLADRTVMRRYVALVDGEVTSTEGLIDGPLGRSPRDATRQAVVIGGREARTRYEVLERLGEFTLLHCRLETGRTHQIRAHLEAIGHAVAGDSRYGSLSGDALGLKRPFLHAETLGFVHPATDELLVFASDLADDLVQALDRLRTALASGEADESGDG